jgi:hypothetical protein
MPDLTRSHAALQVPVREPILAMTSLGQLGRFGNQIFQYAFLRVCAVNSGARVQCPPWVGQQLFGLTDPPIETRLPPAIERSDEFANMFDRIPELIPYIEKLAGQKSIRVGADALDQGLAEVDLCGHFQVHTRRLRPYQDLFQKWFTPAPAWQAPLAQAWQHIRERGRTVIGIHQRRGDWISLPHFGFTLVVPGAWWREWLTGIWKDLDHPILFLCSDDIEVVRPEFSAFPHVTWRDLPEPVRKSIAGHEFFFDFYGLTQCDWLGISNSTFSFAAAMLNQTASHFVRPQWDLTRRLVPFDPWDSPVLLYADHGHGPELFRPLPEVVRWATATEGAGGAVRAWWRYGIAQADMKKTRMFLGYQTRGIRGAAKGLLTGLLPVRVGTQGH